MIHKFNLSSIVTKSIIKFLKYSGGEKINKKMLDSCCQVFGH